jgi:plasmid stabilization system protein ParE
MLILVPGFPKHLVFYRYSSGEEAILIVPVLHGAQNLEAILVDKQ